MLYGFYKAPPLDVITTWDLKLEAYVPAYSHRVSLILILVRYNMLLLLMG